MEAINIGQRLELMVDDFLVDRMHGGIHFQLHSPTPGDIVLELDRPWERGSTHHGYMSVFRDEDRWRMYYGVRARQYRAGKSTSGPERICYAESKDGINWEKPSLGLFEYEGSSDNNIVLVEDHEQGIGLHGFCPFIDENPQCQASARYKAVSRYMPPGATWHTDSWLNALQSADGLRWTRLGDEALMTEGEFDSQNVAFWDVARSEYRLYRRRYYKGADGILRRGIQTATSRDFLAWSQPAWTEHPGAPCEQLYTNQVIPYFRAPHIFTGFPTRYVERPWSEAVEALPGARRRREIVESGGVERLGAALTDTLFMTSRDGVTFRRWGEAFIRPGLREKGNWFYGDNYVARGMAVTPSHIAGAPNELSFYVSERGGGWLDPSDATQKAFRRHTLRMDGFVSLRADRSGGEFTTRPLRFTGNTLQVNFSASAAGGLQIELQDRWGVPLPGFSLEDSIELLGDDLERRVRWRGNPDIGALQDHEIRIRIVLHDADLYAFRFAETNGYRDEVKIQVARSARSQAVTKT